MKPARDSRRDTLRAATRAEHSRTDAAVGAHADVATAEGYQRFLSVMADALRTFGPALDRSSQMAGLSTRSAALVTALEADGAVRTDSSAPHQRSCNDAQAIGVGYALEGSALGAEVLRRRVASGHGGPTSYFELLCHDRRTRWPDFCRWLDQTPVLAGAADDSVVGAVAVFDRVRSTVDMLASETAVEPVVAQQLQHHP